MSVYTNEDSGLVSETLNVSMQGNNEVGYASLQYFSDAAMQAPVIPSAGTAQCTLQLRGAPNVEASMVDGVFDCTKPADQISWRSYATLLTCVPDSIVGATHYKLTVIARN